MADIELVIKIPETLKDFINESPTEEFANHYIKLYDLALTRAIRNGTVIPKGHGRIADVDEAIKCIEEVQGEDAIWAISLIEWACSKRTIIETDKESE